jgi:hypothetical protein
VRIPGSAVKRSDRLKAANHAEHVRPRTHAEITHFFRSLDLVEPGVVTLPMWRPDPAEVGSLIEVSEFCGVGRKA